MDEVFDNMGGGRVRNMNTYSDGSFSIDGKRYGGGSGITQSNLVGINYSDEWTKNSESSLSYFYSGANTKNDNKTSQINFLPSGNFMVTFLVFASSVTAANFSSILMRLCT